MTIVDNVNRVLAVACGDVERVCREGNALIEEVALEVELRTRCAECVSVAACSVCVQSRAAAVGVNPLLVRAGAFIPLQLFGREGVTFITRALVNFIEGIFVGRHAVDSRARDEHEAAVHGADRALACRAARVREDRVRADETRLAAHVVDAVTHAADCRAVDCRPAVELDAVSLIRNAARGGNGAALDCQLAVARRINRAGDS